MLPAHRRQSAATRSVLLASRHAFDVLGWTRLEIQAIADGKTAHMVGCGGQNYCDGVSGYVVSTVDFTNPDAPALRSELDLPSPGWSMEPTPTSPSRTVRFSCSGWFAAT